MVVTVSGTVYSSLSSVSCCCSTVRSFEKSMLSSVKNNGDASLMSTWCSPVQLTKMAYPMVVSEAGRCTSDSAEQPLKA